MHTLCSDCRRPRVRARAGAPRAALAVSTTSIIVQTAAHPTRCTTCLKEAIATRQSEVAELKSLKDAYHQTLRQLQTAHLSDALAVPVAALEPTPVYAGCTVAAAAPLPKASTSELYVSAAGVSACTALQAEVTALSAQVAVANANLEAITQCCSALTAADSCWRDQCFRSWRWAKAAEVASVCQLRTASYRQLLVKLQSITVCNDVFFIWYEAQFGTINGLRLGTLHGQAVDWVELNAALGYVALLITTVANWTGCQFSEYRVVPQGSFSKLTKVGDERNTHELYLTNRVFSSRRFHQSLKCFLSCLKDLSDFATSQDPSLQLPYRVGEAHIHDLPVDMDRPAVWTRAMKYVLTDLKWLLSWASKWRRGSVAT